MPATEQVLPRKSSRGAAEYKKKIEAYKKDSYKYKKRDEGRSVDEKLKTKALLKNIEKFLNRGQMLPLRKQQITEQVT